MTDIYKQILDGLKDGRIAEMANSNDFMERMIANAILKAVTDANAIIILFNDDTE